MSITDTAESRNIARDTRSILKGAGAQLAGKKRGADRRVRRNSFDENDHKVRQLWRPVNGGQKAAGMRWRDALVRTAREYELVGKQEGRRGPLGQHALRVLEELLALIDFRTGRLDPSYARLMARTGFAKSTIASALRRLRAHKFLDWLRRTRVVDTPEGPARRQTSNAFAFDLGQLPRKVLQRFRDLLHRAEAKARALAGDEPITAGAPLIKDRELAAIVARVGALIDAGAE